MLPRIIRIAAALAGCILPLAGCIQRSELTPDPAGTAEAISFSAGSALLRDDAATKGTLKTGTTFSSTNADQIQVYAWHQADGELVFDGTPVSCDNTEGTSFTYSPLRMWAWRDESDWYDFVAVVSKHDPDGTGEKPVEGPAAADIGRETGASTVAVTVSYDARANQYDLMVASCRRRWSADAAVRTGDVPLAFSHQLSAVKIKVINDAVSSSGMTLKSCRFKNLYTTADFTASLDGAGKSSLARLPSGFITSTTFLGYGFESPYETIDKGESYDPAFYDLMVPQVLNGGTNPELHLSYSYTDGVTPVDVDDEKIYLATIKRKDSEELITRWEPGIIYVYEIKLRLGGGVQVDVITTQWDEVSAKTPGLQIN